jgi:hypothetical protein
MFRSEDLVRISADAENYLVLLQTACDIMVDVIREFGLDPGRRGQAPKDSFHQLLGWARENPTRVKPEFELITREVPWFGEINGLRTKIVHRGYHAVVYTNRLVFSLGLAPPDLTFDIPRSKVKLAPMLPLFKRLTFEMLSFSDELANTIAKQRQIIFSRRHVLSGVYVPALNQLRSYQPPPDSPATRLRAQCLLSFRDYLSVVALGYPGGYPWLLLLKLCERLGVPIPAMGEGWFAPGADAEAFFVFSVEQERIGIVVVDRLSNTPELAAAAASATAGADASINRFIVVCRDEHQPPGEPEGTGQLDILVSTDPAVAASRVLGLLNIGAPSEPERSERRAL